MTMYNYILSAEILHLPLLIIKLVKAQERNFLIEQKILKIITILHHMNCNKYRSSNNLRIFSEFVMLIVNSVG